MYQALSTKASRLQQAREREREREREIVVVAAKALRV